MDIHQLVIGWINLLLFVLVVTSVLEWWFRRIGGGEIISIIVPNFIFLAQFAIQPLVTGHSFDWLGAAPAIIGVALYDCVRIIKLKRRSAYKPRKEAASEQ